MHIWYLIVTLGIAALDKGLITVQKADEQDGLAAYRESFAQSYQNRLKAFQKVEESMLANPARYRDIVLEPPMPPNALQPYTADLYGLDHAKRDCRFEMIKIVREVGTSPKEVCVSSSANCSVRLGQGCQSGSADRHGSHTHLAIHCTQHLQKAGAGKHTSMHLTTHG
jgi:hypothetical protein